MHMSRFKDGLPTSVDHKSFQKHSKAIKLDHFMVLVRLRIQIYAKRIHKSEVKAKVDSLLHNFTALTLEREGFENFCEQ